MTNDATLIPLAEVAKTLGSTPLNVLMHIKRGLLTGEEQDGAWWVTSASLATFRRDHGDQKATQVCASGCSKAAACGGGCG